MAQVRGIFSRARVLYHASLMFRLIPTITLTLLLMLLSSVITAQAQAGWVVIAHPSVKLKTNQAVLRRIFMMQRLVDDENRPIQPYSFSPEDERFTTFVSQCLRWPPQVMARRWRRSLTTGEGSAPRFVDSEPQMATVVATQKGAVGYLPSEALSEDETHYKVLYRCEN